MLTLLRGLTVLDLTTIVLGPMATQTLGDLGADVVKIEALDGDLARRAPPHGGHDTDRGAMFVNNNRNKRSIALDLKRPEGQEVLHRLIGRADVLVHNMRPAAAERLGLAPAAVLALNPRIIHCVAVGFGSGGPYAGRPAYDDVIQAVSGVASLPMLTGGAPAYVPTILCDKIAALHVVHAVLAALFARERSGQGLHVEVPMFEAIAAFLLNEHLAAASFSEEGRCGYPRILDPNRRPFRTADGWIAILPYTNAQWRRLLQDIGRTDILAESWFDTPGELNRRAGELYALLAAAAPGRSTAQWCRDLQRLDIPHGPVNSLDDLLTDPHLQAVGFFLPNMEDPAVRRTLSQPVSFAGIPSRQDRAPPGLGAHGREILQEAGMTQAAIQSLIDRGVLGPPMTS